MMNFSTDYNFDYDQYGQADGPPTTNSNNMPTNSNFPNVNNKIVDRMIDYLSRDNAELKNRNKLLEDRLEAYNS
jgi:hypothetical protein